MNLTPNEGERDGKLGGSITGDTQAVKGELIEAIRSHVSPGMGCLGVPATLSHWSGAAHEEFGGDHQQGPLVNHVPYI